MIVGREKEIEFLENFLADLINSDKGRFILLWGTAGVGKTTLLLEFFKRNKKNVVYLGGRNFLLLPPDIGGEIFINQFLSQLPCIPVELIKEWQKIKNKTYSHQIEFILSFPILVAENLNEKLFLLWDDFQLILKLQKNYAPKTSLKIEELMKIYNKSYPNLSVVFCSRWQKPFLKLIKDKNIIDYELKPLSEENSYKLMEALSPTIKQEDKRTLFEFSLGIPLYIRTILDLRGTKNLSIQNVLEEELKYPSYLFYFLYSLIEEELDIARGGNLAYAVLEKLAEVYPNTKDVKELSSLLNRDYPVIREVLRRLNTSELVEFIDGKYRLIHPIFALMLKNMRRNLQIDEKKEKLVELACLLAYASSKSLPKDIFANPDFIDILKIQKIEIEDENKAVLYFKDDKKEEVWIVRVKWAEEPAEEEDLMELLNDKRRKKLKLPYTDIMLLFLSKSGYSTSAILFAKEEKILISIPQDIELLKILLKRE